MLPTLHTNKGDELQLDLHLSSTQGTVEGGPSNRMCQLRLSRMFIERLGSDARVMAIFSMPGASRQHKFGSNGVRVDCARRLVYEYPQIPLEQLERFPSTENHQTSISN